MDKTLTLKFANFDSTWDAITKILVFSQIGGILILIKFRECSSKIENAKPISGKNYFGSFYDLAFWTKQVTIKVDNWWNFVVEI